MDKPFESFARQLKAIRKDIGLSQREVSEATGVALRTLQMIETGKVLPKIETLQYLSPAYKVNLIQLFSETMISEPAMYYEFVKEVEWKIDQSDLSQLEKDIETVKKFIETQTSEYYILLLNQYKAILESYAHIKKDSDYQKALEILIEGLRLTQPDYDLKQYEEYHYSPIEIRLLMNLALVHWNLKKDEMYFDILKFLSDYVSENDNLYPKILYNLSNAYGRFGNHEKELEYVSKSIDAAIRLQSLKELHFFYYTKAIAEFHLKNENWKNSIRLALSICEAYKQEKMKERLIHFSKEKFNMPIDDEGRILNQ